MHYVEIIDLHNKKVWIYSIILDYACMVLYRSGIFVLSYTGVARLTNEVVVSDEDKTPT